MAIGSVLLMESCKKENRGSTINNNSDLKPLSAITVNYSTEDGILKFASKADAQDFYTQVLLEYESIEDDSLQDDFLMNLSIDLGITTFHSVYIDKDEYEESEIDDLINNPYYKGYVYDIVTRHLLNKYGEVMIQDTIYCFYDKGVIISYSKYNETAKNRIRSRNMYVAKNVFEEVDFGGDVKLESYKDYFKEDNGPKPMASVTINGQKHNFMPKLIRNSCNLGEYNFHQLYVQVLKSNVTHDYYVPNSVTIDFGDGNTKSATIANTPRSRSQALSHTYSSIGTYSVTVTATFIVSSGSQYTLTEIYSLNYDGVTCSDRQHHKTEWVSDNGIALECRVDYNRNVFGKHVGSTTWRYEWIRNKWRKRRGKLRAGIVGTMRQADCDDYSTKDNANYGHNSRRKSASIHWTGQNRSHYKINDLISDHKTTNNFTHTMTLDPCD